MKTPWAILSAARPFAFILSVSIHTLVISIPVSMVSTPQSHDMELFLAIEDIQAPPGPEKSAKEASRPQIEAVKQIRGLPEVSRLKEEVPAMVESVSEVRTEPAEEIMEEPIEESIEEPKSESPNVASKTIHQLATENRDPSFGLVATSPDHGSVGNLIKGTTIGTASGGEEHPPVGYNVTGGGAGSAIETQLGASIAPAFLHREMPIYPIMARRLGREGKVMLKLTIDEKGNLTDIEVLEEAGFGLTEAAVEAVRKSTFLPAKKNGKPIASRALLPIKFQLEKNGR